MTTFVYKAKKNSLETVSGTIKAVNRDEAIDLINQLGLLPVTIEEESQESAAVSPVKVVRIKNKELYIFTRQIANLLKSGISLIKAIHIVEEQTVNPHFKQILSQICWEIKNGKSFSESLAMYPEIFSTLMLTMVRAGEESGRLHVMLESISNYQRSQEEIYSKVRLATAYPAFMFVVGAATVYFVLAVVFPKMTGLFESFGDKLPLPTAILLDVSRSLTERWYVVVLGIVLTLLLIKRWSDSESGRAALSRLVLRVPVFGELMLKADLARFCRTMVMLNESGVSILRALQISIPLISNQVIRSHFSQATEKLSSGGSLGESLKEFPYTPKMMAHLIAIGEEAGNLEGVLKEIAENFEQETEEKIKIMTTLIEPLLILLIGLVVGFIVFSMLLPIFQMDILSG